MNYILSGTISAAITALSLLFLKHLAPKIGLMDLPGGRKQHLGNIPLVGGMAILIGFLFTCLILPLPLSPYKPLLGCMTLMLFLGVMDDLHELTPQLRLFGQIIIVLLAMFWGHVELTHLGNLFFSGDIVLHLSAPIFTILAWLSFTNASNMQDGLDGLAGTVNAVQIATLLLIAFFAHAEADAMLLITFLGALIIFLCFNFPLPKNKRPASIFMGDAGSLLLGFFTAWFAIRFSQLGTQAHSAFPPPVTFLWITAVPLFDFFAVTIQRIRQRRSPMSADRAHLHHLLEHYDACYVVIGLGILSAVFSGIGLTLFWLGVNESISFSILLALLVIYVIKKNNA